MPAATHSTSPCRKRGVANMRWIWKSSKIVSWQPRKERMNSARVVEATLRGIRSGTKEYEKWSGYYPWVRDAPEYMVTTAIARAVHNIDAVAFVTVENNVRNAMKNTGGNIVGRPTHRLNLDGRFDLVVWNMQGPRGMIEVKTNVSGYSSLASDVDKLRTALAKSADMRWGLVAYFIAFQNGVRKRGEDRVYERAKAIAERAAREAGGRYRVSRHPGMVCRVPGGAWTGEVLEVRR